MRNSRLAPGTIVGVAVLLAAIGVLPFVLPEHWIDVFIFLFLNVIVVVSFRLVAITGEFTMAHAVLTGCGGYASALLSKELGVTPWLSVPIGAVVAAAIAYVLSFPLFRMKGFYFLIASFAGGEAIRLSWERFRDPFGGYRGLKRIPDLEVGFPGLDFGKPLPFYFLALAIGLICLVVMYRIEHSRFGLNFHAVHYKDSLAESIGLSTRRYRTIAFVTASFFTGLSGALLAHYLGSVNPNLFGLGQMLHILVWSIVGGLGTFAGPIIGVALLSVLDESFRAFDQFRPAIYGIILILTMLFLPTGLESLPEKLKPYLARLFGPR
ncbi:MAG TPA: branched-chain amino acid ABC transporter permease [Alphaproteobacteria bacterium]|nr:branched-chain amino acid ABC transporter permease [Alphaproteobacteria bacterium]